MELVVSEYLYKKYPNLPEGKLTKFRASVVCEDSLVNVANGLNLSNYLRLGRGELASGGSKKPSLLADLVEALIGGIYITEGYNKTKEIILELFKGTFSALEKGVLKRDYKTIMQEYSQEKFFNTPKYKIVGEEGPDHNKTFIVQIYINNIIFGEGKGKSKKEAEQKAAYQAHKRLIK